MGDRSRAGRGYLNRPAFSFALRLALVLAALAGMALSAIAGWANLLERVGDSAMQQAAQRTGTATRTALAEGAAAYRRAAQLEPWQPSHAFKLGFAYEMDAVPFPPLSEDARTAWVAASESYGQAVRLHPANGRLHAAWAWAALLRGDLINSSRAVHAALKLAPDFPDVRYLVARWYLAQWEALSADDQQCAKALVQHSARELPEQYVEVTWQFVRDHNTVRHILPRDLTIRRLLLKKLTEQGLFAERWAELADHPELRDSAPAQGFQVLAFGVLTGRQEPPGEAVPAGLWRGMVEGRLSGELTATVDLSLPPGEVVLYLPMRGVEAAGIWPVLQVTLGGQGLPLPAITGPGGRIAYLLISTPGGRLPLQAILLNSAVVKENGQFVERRVTLGPVKVLIPFAGFSG